MNIDSNIQVDPSKIIESLLRQIADMAQKIALLEAVIDKVKSPNHKHSE